MEEALTAVLLGWAPLTDIVVGGIHWDAKPQGAAFPCVILQTPSARREYTMRGRARLSFYVVQLDGYGRDKAEALAIKRALIGLADSLTAPPLQVEIQAERDTLEVGDVPPSDGVSASDLRRANLDFGIWFTEA